jgi:hypothetical protein
VSPDLGCWSKYRVPSLLQNVLLSTGLSCYVYIHICADLLPQVKPVVVESYEGCCHSMTALDNFEFVKRDRWDYRLSGLMRQENLAGNGQSKYIHTGAT